MEKIRQLYIKTIATSKFKKHYGKNWEKIIRKTIKECSKIYRKKFGIKLILKEMQIKKFVIRTSYIPHSIYDYERAFEEKVRNKFDITIAFTSAPFFTGLDNLGLAFHAYSCGTQNYKNLIVLSNPEKWCWKYVNWSFLTSLLIHEIGHVFQAKDTERAKSYMAIQANTESCHFYYANRKRILKNKWKKFR